MIRFSIDCMPLSKNIEDWDDYNSQIVYAAVADPLFRYNPSSCNYENFACQSCRYISKTKIEIILRKDLYFYNGEIVTAYDYKCSLLKQKSINPYKYNFIRKVKSKKNKLILYLRRRNIFLRELLSRISITPQKNGLTSGPYYITCISDGKIMCSRNMYYRKRLFCNENDKIKFSVIKDPIKNIIAFSSQKTDITCNTIFPINMFKQYQNFINIYPSYIVASVLFCSGRFIKNKIFREYVNHAINKEKLVKRLNNLAYIADDYLVSTYSGKHAATSQIENMPINYQLCKDLKQIVLGYDGFYPNSIICECLAESIRNLGIDVKLCEDKFESPSFQCDIKLVLNYPEYINDASFYLSSFFNKIMLKSPKYCLEYNRMCKMIETEKCNVADGIDKLSNMVREELLIVPLLKMNSIYLCTKKIERFNFVQLNFDDL